MKKFIKILLCVVLVIAIVTAIVVGPYAISFLPFKTDENFDVPIGNIVVNVTDSIKDIDKNGNVTLLDAMLVLNQIVNLTYTVAADVNNDGIVNLLDMLRVLKAIVE